MTNMARPHPCAAHARKWIPHRYAILAVLGVFWLGCNPKRTIEVTVPSRVLEAKSASLEELISLIDEYSAKVRTLTSNSMKVTFTSGRMESGQLQAYRSAPGYILLQRPHELLMNIQNPLTKTTILELLSVGDDFSLWLPSKDRCFEGSNSAKEFSFEDDSGTLEFTARPIHIIEAILPSKIPLEQKDVLIGVEEAQDAEAKYYIVSILHKAGEKKVFPSYKVWIERSELVIVLRQDYEDGGRFAGSVQYSNRVRVDGLSLPLSIRLERPLDGYTLEMRFRDWRLNSVLPENAFVRTPPAGAQVVHLNEKSRRE